MRHGGDARVPSPREYEIGPVRRRRNWIAAVGMRRTPCSSAAANEPPGWGLRSEDAVEEIGGDVVDGFAYGGAFESVAYFREFAIEWVQMGIK